MQKGPFIPAFEKATKVSDGCNYHGIREGIDWYAYAFRRLTARRVSPATPKSSITAYRPRGK